MDLAPPDRGDSVPEGRPIPEPPRKLPDPAAVARAFADAEEVRAVQRGYVGRFAGADRVLDLGCGRGIFLDLLREAGVAAVGIDASEATVVACRERGHDARRADAVAALDEFAARGETFGGIFASHVVEHLPPERVPALFAGLASVLAPGGRAVLVTPDPTNLVVLTEVFWLDPTHVRPWPRAILEALGRAAGLTVVESGGDPATRPRRPPLRRLLARIRSVLSGADRSGPMDSVVVFGRP